MRLIRWIGAAPLVAALCFVAATSAAAQESAEAEIDALIDASATPESALAAARRLEAEGDPIGAAAMSERALYGIEPAEAMPLTLYRIALLCRLGETTSARAEVERLRGLTIGTAEWREIKTSCPGMQRPAGGVARDGNGMRGQLSAGLAYDSDLSGALLARFDIPGAVPRAGGFSFIGSAWLAGQGALSQRTFAYGELGLVTKDSLSGPSVDYLTGDARVGLGTRLGETILSAGAVLRDARVSGDRFVTETGGEAQLAVAVGEGRVVLRGEGVKQDYAAGVLRDGARWDASLGYQTPNFLVAGGYERRTSGTPGADYSGVRAYAGSRIEFKDGSYISNTGSLRFIDYERLGVAPSIKEHRFYGRAAYGIPLGDSGLTLEAAGTALVRGYNSASGLADYRDLGGELRLVWNFGN